MVITINEIRKEFRKTLDERITLRQLEFEIDKGLLEGRKTFFFERLENDVNMRNVIINKYKKSGWKVDYILPRGSLHLTY